MNINELVDSIQYYESEDIIYAIIKNISPSIAIKVYNSIEELGFNDIKLKKHDIYKVEKSNIFVLQFKKLEG